MKKLDQRGAAAFEFCIVAMAVITLIFAVFDLGRYAITVQSLRALANAATRAMIVNCYNSAAISKTTSPSTCTGDYLTTAEKQDIAPFLYLNGLSPTVTTTVSGSVLVVTVSLPGFQMIYSGIWGTSLDAPSTVSKVPF